MANKTTVALSIEQFQEIISVMRSGGSGFRANDRIATALVLEGNMGMRIEDILKLRLSDIIRDGSRYRLDIVEQKTKKKRTFTVPLPIYQYLQLYCMENNIPADAVIFPITERAVQKHLQKVVDYLGYGDSIGTHSFRKFFATEIYKNNNYDIVLVQKLLQHSSVATTQGYINVEAVVEAALQNHVNLL